MGVAPPIRRFALEGGGARWREGAFVMLTKVLCATDLSAAGDVAIAEAGRHARAHGAALIVMHVVPTLYPGVPMTAQGEQAALAQLELLSAATTDELVARTTKLTGRSADDVTIVVEAGVPYVEIARAAAERGADLIVVGSAGAKGWQRLVMGSVATRVVRAAPASVLVARPRPGGGPIVVGVDFSAEARTALVMAAEQARLFGGRLIAVHSVEWLSPIPLPPDELGVTAPMLAETAAELTGSARRRLDEELLAVQVSAERVITEGRAAAALVHLAERERADLIVVGTLGRTGFRRIILGAVAEEVARAAPCPVLVSRTGEQRDR
jgi:nucleotide-binding universal stress UspA family protein